MRNSGKRGVPFPVLKVPGFEHLFDEPEEPVVIDFLRQRREHDLVVERPEAVGDVAFNEPGCPGPGLCHIGKSGVASPAGTETVRIAGEPGLVIRFQQEADYLADDFIRP